MNERIVLLAISALFFLNPVAAIDFSITPSGATQGGAEWGEDFSSGSNEATIDVQSENSNLGMTCTLYQDGYQVDERNVPPQEERELTPEIGTVPSSGTGTMSYSFEVFCDDGWASSSKYTSVDIWYPVNPYFELSPSTSETTMSWGEEQQSSLVIENKNKHFDLSCDISKDGSQVQTLYLEPDRSEIAVYEFSAPETGSGTKTVDISAECSSIYDGQEVSIDDEFEKTKSETISINYPTREESRAQSEINSAESLINEASGVISEAESKIAEAENIQASITEAQNDLDSANTDLSNANTYVSQAETSFEDGNYQAAGNKAEDAQNDAESAENLADDAKTSAQDAIDQKNSDSESKIADVEGKLEDLREANNQLEDSIESAMSKGLDVSSEEQELEDAESSVGDVESLLEDARRSQDSGNYGDAFEEAESALDEANSELEDVRSANQDLESSIPDSGQSNVPQSVNVEVGNLLDADSEVSEKVETLKANNFERSDRSTTSSSSTTYTVNTIYSHPSGETVTLESNVDTNEDKVKSASLSARPSNINERWKEQQSTQETRNSILFIAGAAVLVILAGVFAYYFVNPVNKTVNNFVGEDGESGSSSTFDCPNCGAPVKPDDLEEGECPYCGATVSP